MDRPDDVPGWAWEKAVEATVGTIGFGAQQLTTKLARAIAQAVAEEREACAQIADPIETNERMSDYEKQCFDLRDVISAAIRSRT